MSGQEACVKAATASLNRSADRTAAYIGFGADSGDLLLDGYFSVEDVVRSVIEALIEEPASGALLARVEAVARSLNPLRTEDHIKSVALDGLSIHRAILRAAMSETSKSVG